MSQGTDEIIAVWNADGGLRGELRYITLKLLGKAKCELCDITHSMLGEKGSWCAAKDRIALPFRELHRDEMEEPLARFVGQRLPIVVSRHGQDYFDLVSPEELAECAGRVDDLEARILERLSRSGERQRVGT